jgi:hypothetical protein
MTDRDPPNPPLEPGADLALVSTLTCPLCGGQATETMPTNACWFFYDCRACGARLRPKPGQCCVFCSYGAVPCPPMQAADACPHPLESPPNV